MRRQVRWTKRAVKDLKAQTDYIALDRPLAAERVAQRVNEVATGLGVMPSGRKGHVDGTFERPISDLPLVIVFRIRPTAGGETIRILRVIHMARDWRDGSWPD